MVRDSTRGRYDFGGNPFPLFKLEFDFIFIDFPLLFLLINFIDFSLGTYVGPTSIFDDGEEDGIDEDGEEGEIFEEEIEDDFDLDSNRDTRERMTIKVNGAISDRAMILLSPVGTNSTLSDSMIDLIL